MDEIRLREPVTEWKAEYLAMLQEFVEEDPSRLNYRELLEDARADFPGFVRRLHEKSQGIGLSSRQVPSTDFWLVRNEAVLVGQSSFRHRLEFGLEHEGGHIGYGIRPSERLKGYGTLILALTMEKAHERGLNRVLVTCDADNLGSARIIRKNGGLLENEVLSHSSGKPVSRYWIDL